MNKSIRFSLIRGIREEGVLMQNSSLDRTYKIEENLKKCFISFCNISFMQKYLVIVKTMAHFIHYVLYTSQR